ncbi:MAG: CPBP family intramembrane metalloprotease [Candidatus Eremiobacteraeota bacterium]|nr:CPBP family intramembrane metalloprotease [Candidatus Eremiobacteraeota bacterium]MBV8584315.1 CPBP family intramembrane metalloprotease [Candidatus Eremiobacteraeota bacterium]MBV8655921.1 CPBP family intramembrane metalloprotease [Candidatus Eremiobacteraeota bacterium]
MNDSTSTISPAWPTRWPKDSFRSIWTWVLAILVALAFVGTFLLGIKQSSSGTTLKNVPVVVVYISLLLTFAFEGVVLLAVLLSLPAISKFSLAELGFRKPTRSAVIGGIGGAIAMIVVANGGASLIDYLAHSKHEQDVIELFRGIHDPVTIVVFVLFACVFAPFAEESIFRVFFFNLGLRYGGFWAGAIVSGVLFGLAHGDAFAALPLAAGGMILCYVYYRTRNAFASMISHSLFNTFSIVALLLTPGVTQ